MQQITIESNCPAKSAPIYPLDQDQLARYTLGDQYAEQTILSLFQKQSAILIKRLKEAQSEMKRQKTALTIRESASGIGAYKIVKDAVKIGQLSEFAPSREQLKLIGSLEKHIQEVNEFIDTRLNLLKLWQIPDRNCLSVKGI